jgi:hypothetical protein
MTRQNNLTAHFFFFIRHMSNGMLNEAMKRVAADYFCPWPHLLCIDLCTDNKVFNTRNLVRY